MIDVSTQADDDLAAEREPCQKPVGTATIERYETEESVVFYDAENPLAWVETTRAMSLEENA
ncbi:hypothetical protein OB905_03345 [Halobacteria archaeon AArc-dxtr1]|nr:hypothetical protein [Halobacteria archaeon AArc-dxtr1]